MGKKIWETIISGYQTIACWFPPLVYMGWSYRYSHAVDPDPTPFLWWLHKLIQVAGVTSFFLALVCTFRADDSLRRAMDDMEKPG